MHNCKLCYNTFKQKEQCNCNLDGSKKKFKNTITFHANIKVCTAFCYLIFSQLVMYVRVYGPFMDRSENFDASKQNIDIFYASMVLRHLLADCLLFTTNKSPIPVAIFLSTNMGKVTKPKATTDELPSNVDNELKTTESKRSKVPEKWKQNVRKHLRQSGQEYVSVTGKLVNKRKVHPGCGTTCHLNCNANINSEQRLEIHNMFWKLTDEQKNFFYWKYTSRILPKRRRATSTEETRRGYTFKYRFELKGELQYVCSKFFFATLDISPRRIYYFYEHCYDEEICMPRTDTTQGKGRQRMPQLAQRLDEIRDHIKTFPTECKDGSNKLYLPVGMSLCKMYNMYAEKVKEPLKQHWYNKVFQQEFNLEFIISAKKTSPEDPLYAY